jgi:NADH-quinone oxidoreductase subunit G
MTIAPHHATGAGAPVPAPTLVSLTIDGIEVSVPKGTVIIRAAEQVGVQIPRFCDHPLLDPIGACRQCIVEVEGQRKPVTACTTTVMADMVVKTQHTSAVADKAQHGQMEMLLINHPLDCPICDKGGECPLQNQALSNGRGDSRFHEIKRTYEKPIAISSEVLLDRERCVLCARCTRFSQQVAGDPFIELFERGALEQVAVDPDEPFQSYFSSNTVQICPVGALTGASYRFQARPFDLVSSPGVCEHCASGCAQRTDHRRGRVLRRLAGDDHEVNEEWNCDKGRWAFEYARQPDRLRAPLIRDRETGEQHEVSWSEALSYAARGLAECVARHGTAVLAGGRHSTEDAYAYAKFARVALGTADMDFRARPSSAEEAAFLRSHVIGRTPAGRHRGVTYADLETAGTVVLVAFEPEEESPIVFLRLRKAARKRGLKVVSVGPFTTPSVVKTFGSLVRCCPGDEPAVLAGLALPERAIVLVGERLASVSGGFSAVARLAERTGARVAWVPRRAGERGALEAGLLPELGARDLPEILDAAYEAAIDGLVVGGLDPADLPDPILAREALARVPFLVSLELRHSAVTELADVVFPVAAAVEKAGSFVDWEGRERPFERALPAATTMTDLRVLHTLAGEMGVALGLPSVEAARSQLLRIASARDTFGPAPTVATTRPPEPAPGEAILATWSLLLDDGRMQDGEPHLAGTRKLPTLHLSGATAAALGARPGELVKVGSGDPQVGSITLPLVIADLPDGVVWLPTSSPGSHVREQLGAAHGDTVRVAAVRSEVMADVPEVPNGAGSQPAQEVSS